MYKTRRFCIPLGLSCNLQCQYCYRDLEKLNKIPDFTEGMIRCLNNLDPSWCEAVIASGGEPLLYWDKVLELFSYVPKNVHKVIMTNGTLMTQEIVNYINDNDIELHLSHDGTQTKFLRGVDIFDDERLLSLFRQINIIRLYSVVTSYNNDIWENFFDSVSRLKRTDIIYEPAAMGDNNIPQQQHLINNFDYELYARTFFEFKHSHYYIPNPWRMGRTLTADPIMNNKAYGGFNILPDGTICGMTRICDNYGNIQTSTYEEAYKEAMRQGIRNKCKNCKLNYMCFENTLFESDHTCKIKKALLSYQRRQDIETDIDIITANAEKKYGYKK